MSRVDSATVADSIKIFVFLDFWYGDSEENMNLVSIPHNLDSGMMKDWI